MPELSSSIGTLPEEAMRSVDFEAEQALRAEAAAVIGDHSLRGYDDASGTSTSLAEAPDAVPEMPPEHPDIDPATLTVGGLIKACSHFAAIAASNPALAERMAERTIEFKRNEAEMRQQGMGHEAVRKQQWSSMLKRHKDKTSAGEAPKTLRAAEKPVAEQTSRLAPEASTVTPPTDSGRSVAGQASIQHAIHYAGEERAADDIVTREVIIPAVPQALSHIAGFAFTHRDALTRAAHDHRLFNEQRDTESASPDIAADNDELVPRQEAAPESAIDAGPTPVKDAMDLMILEHPLSGIPDANAEISRVEELLAIGSAASSSIENERHDILNQQSWGEIAEGEPLVIYDCFANTLREAVTPSAHELAISDENTPAIEPTVLTEAAEGLQAPAIVATINEHLADLGADQKAAYAPLLGDIMEKAQAASRLIAEGAKPEAVEDAQLQLEDLTVQLLEQLGIVYEHEDVKHFVSTLLRLDFRPAGSEDPATVDLESEGTHEAKLHFTQFMGNLSDVEETIERLLGKLVIFHATPSNAADSLPAAA